MEARRRVDVFLKGAAGSAKEEKDMARGWRSLESSGGGNAVCDRGGLGQIVGNSMRGMKLYWKNHDGRNTAMGHGNLASRRATREREGERM